MGDVRQLNIDDVDSIIKDFHAEQSTANTPLLKPVSNGKEEDVAEQEAAEEPSAKNKKYKSLPTLSPPHNYILYFHDSIND